MGHTLDGNCYCVETYLQNHLATNENTTMRHYYLLKSFALVNVHKNWAIASNNLDCDALVFVYFQFCIRNLHCAIEMQDGVFIMELRTKQKTKFIFLTTAYDVPAEDELYKLSSLLPLISK